MNEDITSRLGLPLLHAGQAQKEIDHNEALALLDIAVQPVVIAIGLDTPPAEPAAGACWIVGPSPVGAWAGQGHALAGWTAGGWRFVAPRRGMNVLRESDGIAVRYDGSAWLVGELWATSVIVAGERVLGAQQAAIAVPLGGSTVDAEARAALGAVLSALRVHGLIAQ